MSITDELREWANDNTLQDIVLTTYPPQHAVHGVLETLLRIADHIDEEHERLMQEQPFTIDMIPMTDERMAEYGWMRLPKDADGEYIHIGDVMVSKDGNLHRVDSLTRNPTWFDYEWSIRLALLNDGVGAGNLVWYLPDTLRHHHAPTVEDVLREFAAEFNRDDSELCDEEIIERFAAKLRLAGDAE